MAKKPEPPAPVRWTIYKIAARQSWVGEIDAADEASAIEKAAKEFRIDAHRLLAVLKP